MSVDKAHAARMADPVCGMPVAEGQGIRLRHGETVLAFCTEFCRQQFLRHPGAYASVAVPRLPAVADLRLDARKVAYFSMEVALDPRVPTYSGGLGVLAGDTLRSAADLSIPMIGITFVHREGYFHQEIRDGSQFERPERWSPEDLLTRFDPTVEVSIEGRRVRVGAWRMDVVGSGGHVVPLVLLDTDLADNAPRDRDLSRWLYGGDERYRLGQEAVLGIGGVRMLRALGCTGIDTFHMNEGHAALAPLEILRVEQEGRSGTWDFLSIRNRCVFTTHTPVPAGHDRFERGLARTVLGDLVPDDVLAMLGGREELNMTQLALNLSHYVNGVAMRHREVSAEMFPAYEIHQITNGVHSRTWTSPSMAALFDRRAPGWRNDPALLRNAAVLTPSELWGAHEPAKARLLEEIRARTGRRLRGDVLTIGYARRATRYKRPGLVFADTGRLRSIARRHPFQFVFAGKAHPRDEGGKEAIRRWIAEAGELGDEVPVVFLPGYDLELARLLVAGVDVWLNTPQRPQEASGTSGMKAAHNGVPSLSTLDGWWREGHVEGVTGWSIGGAEVLGDADADRADAADLYDKLERCVLPAFYGPREGWTQIMAQTIALNASFFNTHRMVGQYALHAYAL